MWWASVLILANALWLGVFLGRRANWQEERATLLSHYGYCGAQCERFRMDMIECHLARREVFTLDERREECQRHLIRWSDIPMTCYRWE
jgi:hypothetical protein